MLQSPKSPYKDHCVCRRSFIKRALLGTGLLMSGTYPFSSFAQNSEQKKLTILYTGDIHGRLSPFPEDSGPFEGLGGLVLLALQVANLRATEGAVLLLDAGDMLQPRPDLYITAARKVFNNMQQMGYDAATLGNCDIANGLDFLEAALPTNFPLVLSDRAPSLSTFFNNIPPGIVIKKQGMTIGIIALGNLQGMSMLSLEETIQLAEFQALKLNIQDRCDFVICLSRLDGKNRNVDILNYELARNSSMIDLIISGGTHAFEHQPAMVLNRTGKKVLITKTGWGGMVLGQLNYDFHSKNSSKLCNAQSVITGKQTRAV